DSRSRGIFVRTASACSLPVAAAIIATVFGAPRASATTINYTSYSWIGDTISITSPPPQPVSGGAGQITLKGVTGLGPSTTTLLAWCLDVFDFLKGSGTYTGGGPLANASNLIGGVMTEGNSYIAQGGAHVIGGITYSENDISAATQIAIWSLEYSNFKYN